MLVRRVASRGNIAKKITQGIDETCLFLAFITDAYVATITEGCAKDGGTDWCSYEFSYAAQVMDAHMVGVVLDAGCRGPWLGKVGERLNGRMFHLASADKTASWQSKCANGCSRDCNGL